MKNINVSAIILAAEKAEKDKMWLKREADRALKTADTCTTDERKAYWQTKASDLLNMYQALDVSFYKPLDEALAVFEKPYRIRCFESAKNLLADFQKVLEKIDIPKKYFDGTMISIKAYAGTFPSAYKGTPTTTEAIFSNKNGKWYLTILDRITVKKDRVECVFSDVTKEAIVKKYKSFYF
jgi:hypothetical protein